MKTLNFKTWVMLLCVASTMMFASCKETNEPDDPTNKVPENPTPEPESPSPETPELAYELRTLTFEDADAKFSSFLLDYANATINTWSNLIDNPQYGGPLTYDNTESAMYTWFDEYNTELTHSFFTPYWNGGHVISNYVLNGFSNNDLPEGNAWYQMQLSILSGGHNNSKNFCIHNGYVDNYTSEEFDGALPYIMFADGKARVIDHMYVTNTCYTLNSLTYGDGYCPAATNETTLSIIAYGYDADGHQVGSTTFKLCEGTNMVKEWTKWDLSVLGNVLYVAFNFEASSDLIGEYGLKAPAYFAYDDIAVQFDKELEF